MSENEIEKRIDEEMKKLPNEMTIEEFEKRWKAVKTINRGIELDGARLSVYSWVFDGKRVYFHDRFLSYIGWVDIQKIVNVTDSLHK